MSAIAKHSPHRRLNALTGEWVLVSPHRLQRPWRGREEHPAPNSLSAYDPACYLCPGNLRANGRRNPRYLGTFSFTNDFPALLQARGSEDARASELLHREQVKGTCRVTCFSPRHDLTLAEMPEEGLLQVIGLWMKETRRLGKEYRWVQVFENKGEAMGCSNHHPHGQIWATSSLPTVPAAEDERQAAHFGISGRPLLMDYLALEQSRGERMVIESEHWVVVSPYWGVWPFETLLLPKRHTPRIVDLTEAERLSLAATLKALLVRYDNLFETSFPYSMGWHGAPFGAGGTQHWQLHAHFFPPLLRSATVRKFMVGYELLGEPQRDLTPERAAERLRDTSEVHYKLQGKSP